MNLTPVQQQIVDTPGNLIVRASAGTGKTHTMVAKIATEIEHNHTHKSIAAITFTIKAAQEIKDRLTIDSSRHFIGTNNSFVIEEIIKPFLKDVYGAEFEVDMSTDYSIRIDTFEAGLDKVKREQVLCSYTDSKKNFVFDLALDVIMKSSACRLYLQAKYFKIYMLTEMAPSRVIFCASFSEAFHSFMRHHLPFRRGKRSRTRPSRS